MYYEEVFKINSMSQSKTRQNKTHVHKHTKNEHLAFLVSHKKQNKKGEHLCYCKVQRAYPLLVEIFSIICRLFYKFLYYGHYHYVCALLAPCMLLMVVIIMMIMTMFQTRYKVSWKAVDLGPTLYTGYVKVSNDKMKLTRITVRSIGEIWHSYYCGWVPLAYNKI